MSIYETSITNPKKKLEFYKQLSEQLQQENQQLKLINKEYERLDNGNKRGFTITSVKQYNIDELIKCKNNWNKLKEYIEQEISIPIGGREFCCYSNVRDKIKELERGVSDVED